jgi:SAM-dependent methyltransferase
MAVETGSSPAVSFLDMQAYVGITKHVGGIEATDELLALCRIGDAREILNVGCGIGVGPAYIAKTHDCHVTGVDISDKMIEWSHRRARAERVETKVEFRRADVLDMPFEVGRFDVVICESVLIFVEDKAQAIRECVRVAKPGGYVGLNEAVWIKQPSPELVAQVKDAIGPFIPTQEAWEALWGASGLQDRVVKIRQVDARTEVRSRIQWIGWRWLLGAWGRGLRLYITKPAVRQSIKEVFDVPAEVFQYAGYGLFAGRK